MTRPNVPPGHALVRLADLAALLAPEAAPVTEPPAYTATWASLGVATGMLTADLSGCKSVRAELADGVAPEHIIGSLVTIAAAVLREHTADEAEGFLQHLGAIAACRGERPDGQTG